MTTTFSGPKIYLIYSTKDESICTWVQSYLNEFKLKGIIHHYQTMSIETLRESGSDREIIRSSRDIMLLLASPNFLKSDFLPSASFQEMISRHRQHRSLLVPLFFFEVQNIPSRLNNLARLDSNKSTIIFDSLSQMHEQLIPVFEELTSVVKRWATFNDTIDENWKKAKELHSYDGYLAFQKIHFYSVYSQQAEEYIKELKEEKLWKEALSFNQMKYYYAYLSQAPLKKYEEACIKKILKFESTQEVAQTDAIKNKNIALALNFKSRYDKKAYTPDIDQHLLELFNNKDLEAEPLNTEGFFLQEQALKNCTAEEIFSLNLSLQYDKHLKRRLLHIITKLRSFHAAYIFTATLSIFLFIYLFFYNALRMFQPGETKLGLFVAYIILAYLAYRCITGVFYAHHRIRQQQTFLDQIKKDYIYLQIAAINHDQIAKKRILLSFVNLNAQLMIYEKVSLFSFIGVSEGLGE